LLLIVADNRNTFTYIELAMLNVQGTNHYVKYKFELIKKLANDVLKISSGSC